MDRKYDRRDACGKTASLSLATDVYGASGFVWADCYYNGCTLRFRQSMSKKVNNKYEPAARAISTRRYHTNRSLRVHYSHTPVRPPRGLDNNLRWPRLLDG